MTPTTTTSRTAISRRDAGRERRVRRAEQSELRLEQRAALLDQLKFDPNLQTGWGKRGYNWEFSAGVQHQLLPAHVDRRRLLPAAGTATSRSWTTCRSRATDFNYISLTAPADSRLPDGGGYTVTGFPVVKPTVGFGGFRRHRTSSSCRTTSAGRSSTGTGSTSTSTGGCRTASSLRAASAPGARAPTTAPSSRRCPKWRSRPTTSSARSSSRRCRRSSASRTACSSRR